MTAADSLPDDDTPKSTTGARPGREAKVVRKRFYSEVSVAPEGAGFAIHLDGRGVKTPKKSSLLVSNRALAEAIAEEWRSQGAAIEPQTMPLTTLACTALDAVAAARHEVAAEIGRYAASDLLCYRAEAPAALAAHQEQLWAPLLAWAEAELGVTFRTGAGLMPIAQPAEVAPAVLAEVERLEPLPLAAVSVLTSLTGSAVLALAVLRRRLSLDEAWLAAHVDEDWQAAQWGQDGEAAARRAARYRDATAAALVLAAMTD